MVPIGAALERRMYDENDPAVVGMMLTGSIILSLIWTLLVSAMLFALAG